MPGKRVIMVSVYAEPLCGNVLRIEWRSKDRFLREASHRGLPEAVVHKAAKQLSRMHGGHFRPFLGGCPGWVWRPERTCAT